MRKDAQSLPTSTLCIQISIYSMYVGWGSFRFVQSLDSLVSKQSQLHLQTGRTLSLSPFVEDEEMAIKLCCFPKDPLGDVETWSESVDRLLSCKAGQIAFREFLKSEYSEENILFWLACEEYKKTKTVPEMISSANRIYSEFVQTEAPKQINIDCGTRESITKNISQPTLTSFDTAQKLIYSLMARDCYPRFLKSDIYQGLLRRGDSR
ncbi:regulator of G-protein signaling 21-like isoform X2 [Notolabrus celidotus]|nr:regulator of G-protein signaling 21-like isoform X2 [Notolabrus celidotus]